MDNWHWILVERIGEWRTLSCMSFSWRTVSCSCRWVTATTLQKILLQLTHQHQERSIHTLITWFFHFTEARREISSEVPHRIRWNCSGRQQRRSEEDPQPSYQIQYNDCKFICVLQFRFKKNITNKITIDDRCGPWLLTSELSTWWTRPRWARSCTSW